MNNETKKTWGGVRQGAGRKDLGRKRRQLYLTEQELKLIKEYIKKLRES